MQTTAPVPLLPRRLTRRDYIRYKEAARGMIHRRLDFYTSGEDGTFGTVAIRNQKTRWGSCSTKRNLNFNYKLIFLPDRLQDYVIVHELCHLKEFNHSPRFWRLVEGYLPNYRQLRKELKAVRLR